MKVKLHKAVSIILVGGLILTIFHFNSERNKQIDKFNVLESRLVKNESILKNIFDHQSAENQDNILSRELQYNAEERNVIQLQNDSLIVLEERFNFLLDELAKFKKMNTRGSEEHPMDMISSTKTVTDSITPDISEIMEKYAEKKYEDMLKAQQDTLAMESRLVSENRDPVWATTMEVDFQNAFHRSTLGAGGVLNSIECRSTICEINISFEENTNPDVMGLMMGFNSQCGFQINSSESGVTSDRKVYLLC